MNQTKQGIEPPVKNSDLFDDYRNLVYCFIIVIGSIIYHVSKLIVSALEFKQYWKMSTQLFILINNSSETTVKLSQLLFSVMDLREAEINCLVVRSNTASWRGDTRQRIVLLVPIGFHRIIV